MLKKWLERMNYAIFAVFALFLLAAGYVQWQRPDMLDVKAPLEQKSTLPKNSFAQKQDAYDQIGEPLLSLEFVARREHAVAHEPQEGVDPDHDRQPDQGRRIGMADESVTESVYGIEKRIDVGERLERLGKPFDRIERPREERQRRDHEIGHRRDVIEFLRPYAADRSQ